MIETSYYYQFTTNPDIVINKPYLREQLTGQPGVAINTSDLEVYDAGYARGWIEEHANPYGRFAADTTPAPTLDPTNERCTQVQEWTDATEEEKRSSLSDQIDQQVPDATLQARVKDPLVESDIARSLAAATDKHVELDDTDAVDLDTFDSALAVAPPQNGQGYSQLAVSIIELPIWAGAPDNNLGFEAVLNIETDYEDQGAEARLYVIDAPSDAGAVLPFVQDTENPKRWSVEARDGHKWQDPDETCTVQLLWGAGSLPTSQRMKCKGKYDRQAAMVRYAVPTNKAIKKKNG